MKICSEVVSMTYRDRKNMKWGGFQMTEQVAMIAKKRELDNRYVQGREQQSESEIAENLSESYKYKLPANVQLNRVENGCFQEDLVGIVEGFGEDEEIYLRTKKGMARFRFGTIRNVIVKERTKWYQ
jgi:hypothetical protein